MITYKDRIGEVPDDWEVVVGYEQLTLESGMRPSKHVTDDENDIPSIGGENITSDGFLTFENLRFISKEYYKIMPKGKLQPKDILINKDGANTGKIAFAKNKPFKECAVNEHVFLIRNKGDFEQEFLFYFLLSSYGQIQIQRKVVGSAQGGINNSFTKGVFIPKPPMKEQRAISNIFNTIDQSIASTNKIIISTERIKSALIQNVLTGKIKPDGKRRGTDELHDTKLGLFPKDWGIFQISEISTQVTDGEHTTPKRTDKGNLLLSARNIKDGYLDLTEVDYVNDIELKRIHKRCNPQKGDLLISCSGTLGNVCLVPEGLAFGMVRSVALVKFKQELIDPEFTEILFQAGFMKRQMLVAVSSSVQGNLFQGAIKKLRVPLPPKEERMEIVEKFKTLNSLINHKREKVKKLERLKKSLMQNLLTGKVRVDVSKIKID